MAMINAISVFKNGDYNSALDFQNVAALQWYTAWLEKNMKRIPKKYFFESAAEKDCAPLENEDALRDLFNTIALCLHNHRNASVNNIVHDLMASGLIREAATHSPAFELSSTIVFAVLGWQTMLYKCAFDSAPRCQIAVVDEQDGFSGQAFMTRKQSLTQLSLPLHEFLLGFGLLLPSERQHLDQEAKEDSQALQAVRTLDPQTFNAAYLHTVANIRIKWVDSLSIHLEYDAATRTLFLFRYPSFCLLALTYSAPHVEKPHSPTSFASRSSILHHCTTPSDSSSTWASPSDVSALLTETLRSYRLLFGQSHRGRRHFRSIAPPRLGPDPSDRLLTQLCQRKTWPTAPLGLRDRDLYSIKSDFALLGGRLAALRAELDAQKPRSWRDMWRDRRESVQWYTFWAVIVFGGLRLVGTYLQVVLQAVQLGFTPSG